MTTYNNKNKSKNNMIVTYVHCRVHDNSLISLPEDKHMVDNSLFEKLQQYQGSDKRLSLLNLSLCPACSTVNELYKRLMDIEGESMNPIENVEKREILDAIRQIKQQFVTLKIPFL